MDLNAAYLDHDKAFCQSRAYLNLLLGALTRVSEYFVLREEQSMKNRVNTDPPFCAQSGQSSNSKHFKMRPTYLTACPTHTVTLKGQSTPLTSNRKNRLTGILHAVPRSTPK